MDDSSHVLTCNSLSGGALFLYELIINTKQFCFLNNSRMPFLCMDLIYIIVLLRDLYGLSVYDKIMVRVCVRV